MSEVKNSQVATGGSTISNSNNRTKSDNAQSSGSSSLITEPFAILKKAIKEVPFVKYALGIAGIAAAIAIIKSFGIEKYDIPIIALIVFLGLMVLVFVFSSLTNSNDKYLKFAGYVLVYTITLLTCLGAILLVLSIFFRYPDTFENIINASVITKLK